MLHPRFKKFVLVLGISTNNVKHCLFSWKHSLSYWVKHETCIPTEVDGLRALKSQYPFNTILENNATLSLASIFLAISKMLVKTQICVGFHRLLKTRLVQMVANGLRVSNSDTFVLVPL
jgi:hypothetical protein